MARLLKCGVEHFRSAWYLQLRKPGSLPTALRYFGHLNRMNCLQDLNRLCIAFRTWHLPICGNSIAKLWLFIAPCTFCVAGPEWASGSAMSGANGPLCYILLWP